MAAVGEIITQRELRNNSGQILCQERLQWAEATFDPLPLDAEAARSYGRIYAAVQDTGRQPRKRASSLFIAAIAVSNELPLLTRNPDDFSGLADLVDIVPL